MIHQHDAQRTFLEDLAEALLAFAQCLGRVPRLRQVRRHTQIPGDTTGGIAQSHGGTMQPSNRAARMHAAIIPLPFQSRADVRLPVSRHCGALLRMQRLRPTGLPRQLRGQARHLAPAAIDVGVLPESIRLVNAHRRLLRQRVEPALAVPELRMS